MNDKNPTGSYWESLSKEKQRIVVSMILWFVALFGLTIAVVAFMVQSVTFVVAGCFLIIAAGIVGSYSNDFIGY